MKSFKIGMIALFLLAGTMLAVSTANATCTAFGYFIRVVTFEGKTYAMFRTNLNSTTDGNYYQIEAQDPQVAMAVYQAYKGGSRAYVRTTQSSCNTTVTLGNRIDLGVADRIGLGY